MDQYELVELRRSVGNRVGGFGNAFRYKRSLHGAEISAHISALQMSGADYTTTNTTQYLYVLSGTIRTFSRANTSASGFFTTAEMMAQHSVAGASVDLRFYVDDTSLNGGVGLYFDKFDGVYIPSTTLWLPVTFGNIWSLASFNPGSRTAGLVARNNTAGTLTIRGSNYTAWSTNEISTV